MIIEVLQPSDPNRHKLCKYGGYLLYQEYCEIEHSTAAELPHLADNLSFKNWKAECMVDCFGLTNL
jgi:hypothetical protein